jgi:hypothetical protein
VTQHVEDTDSELRVSNIDSRRQDLIVLAVGKIGDRKLVVLILSIKNTVVFKLTPISLHIVLR